MAQIPYSQRKSQPNGTRGGTGSFSYADTKVYAPGAAAAFWMQQTWRVNNATGEVLDNGTHLWVPGIVGGGVTQLIPGQGGGAKLPGKRLYGGGGNNSAASIMLGAGPGPNPNGFVLIRLMKID